MGALLVLLALYELVDGSSWLIARQEMRQVAHTLQQKPDDGTPFLVSAWAAPAFEVYGGPLLKRQMVWLPDLRISAVQVYEGWLKAGQPAKLWLVVSHSDFIRTERVFEQIEPFSEVKKVIKNGASGAYLLELKPEDMWQEPEAPDANDSG